MANIKVFEDKKIRTEWDAEKEDWWFSDHDVVQVLSDCKDVRDYIKKMRKRDEQLNLNWGTICPLVESVGNDGKRRKILMANTRGVLRLVQSIPSKKAEPFKLWLAQVGGDRLDEIADPEKAMQRGADFYRAKGYSPEWITQRLLSIKIRKELTDEWKERGIEKESDYAILTNELTKAWSGRDVKSYKALKNLKKESLRDNMTDIELTINQLAELTTKTISQQEKPETFAKSKDVARRGGKVAKNAKDEFEKATGTKVVSSVNATNKKLLNTTPKNEDD